MSYTDPEELPFVPTQGVPISPNPERDNLTRIQETMIDLQVVVEGCVALQSTYYKGETVKALARACSMFLRKLVLGDRGEKKTRLLNDEICKQANLFFSPLRKIPKDRRNLNISRNFIFGMQAIKVDEPDAGKTYVSIPSRQSLELTIEWPLPGMADWVNQPSDDSPWIIHNEGLFDFSEPPTLDCDAWLGQQLVVFNTQGIPLRKILGITANTEGAHSPPMDRLIKAAGQDDIRDRMIKDNAVHILSSLLICDVHYNHAIAIETGLYVYQQLAQNKFFRRPSGEINLLSLCFLPQDAFSNIQKWLGFSGGLIVAHHGQCLKYNIRAPH